MKIAVISAQVFACPPPGYAGLEMIAWLVAKGLASKGHRVTLIAPDGSSCPGCDVVHTGPPGEWDERAAYGGAGERKDKDGNTVRAAHPGYWQHLNDMDAIIDHSWQKWAYVLKEEGQLKAPVLGVLHAPVDTMYRVLPPLDKPCFVAISKDQASHFQALFSREAKVAYNGIDLDFYKATGTPRTKRFLFLARFSSIKGADLAIEACKQAGVGLDLVGDTGITGEPEYLNKIKAACDGKQIRLVGNATRGECVHWFSQAHALLHPVKRFREPFGLAPVEAMACGCPVISWDNGALRETILHNVTGVLVKSLQDMVDVVRFYADPNWHHVIDEHRKDCREQAKKFSVQNMVDSYERLCQEAVETGGW
jgi:glycosyltransferase involved in cell wall biosynthesis